MARKGGTMSNNNGKRLGILATWVSIAIILLGIFAGLITSLNRADATEKLANQNKDKIEIVMEKTVNNKQEIEVLKTHLNEIQKSQDKMDRKLDRLLEKVK